MDDEGALHVVEALMAGTIILTAIIFLSLTAAPSPSGAITGTDLTSHAVDILAIMSNAPPEESVADQAATSVSTWSSRLEEIMSHGLANEAEVTADTDYIDELVGVGNRWQLRLDNGVEPLVVMPYGTDFAQPRGAKAAERFIAPPWGANLDDCVVFSTFPILSGSPFYPGGPGPDLSGKSWLAAPIPSTTDPQGARTGPDAVTWLSWWQDRDPDTVSTNYRVPNAAPYGWWIVSDGVTTNCFEIAARDGTTAAVPAYGAQLLVWPIAG